MKKKILMGILSLALTVQPAAICMAEDFSMEMQMEEISQEEAETEETQEILENEAVTSEEEVQETQPDGFELSLEDGEDTEEEIAISEEENDENEVSIQEETEELFSDSGTEDVKSYQIGNGSTAELKDGVLTVSGNVPDYEDEANAPWYNDRFEITKIIFSEGITRIGNNSFEYCYNVQEIVFPESLTEIGVGVFLGDSSLEEIKIPNAVKKIDRGAFVDCSGVKTVDLGQGVQEIEDYAFENISATSVSIPASVKTLSRLAFFDCQSLEAVNIDCQNAAYTSVDGVLFSKDKKTLYLYPINKTGTDYAVPSGVTAIGDSAFQRNKNIRHISFPGTLTKIADWAFAESSLETLTVPDTVTEIGDGIADTCQNLQSAVIGNGVSSLEYRTFNACSKLTKVTVGRNVTVLDMRVFKDCTSLTSVVLPEGLKKISVYTFYGCTSLTFLNIPSTVDVIEDGAFEGCTKLKVTYPSGLTKMDDGSYRRTGSLNYTGTYHYNAAYQVLSIVNQERAKEGLPALAMDQELLEGAMKRAAETCLDFSHTRPTSLSCFSISSKASGENIAAGSSTAAATMNQWMNSAGHRANILGASYKSIGIGCFEQDGMWFWVQIFSGNTTASFAKPADRKVKVKIDIAPENYKEYISLNWSDYETEYLTEGGSHTLKVYITNPGWSWVYSNPDGDSFKWSSSNTKVVTVDGNGKITGRSAGTARITASGAGLTASMDVTVKAAKKVTARSISLNKKTASLLKGKKLTLKATTKPAGKVDLTWTSSNKKVATVDKNGKVTARKKGTAVITVKTPNGKKATCKVTVKEIKSKKIKLNTRNLKAYKGYKFRAKATLTPKNSTDKITWKSSNPKVATVSSKGVITMKKKGKATITARTESGKKAIIKVTVWNKKKVVK